MPYRSIRHQGVDFMTREVGDDLELLAPIDDFDFAVPTSHDGVAGVPAAGSVPAVPVPSSAAVFCVGLNYKRHADESGFSLPEHPDIFLRMRRTLAPNREGVPVPRGDEGLDWEGELAAIVGDVTAARGQRIFGYTCLNDLSARTYQMRTSQWAVGKNAVKSAPIGDRVVSPTELDVYAQQLTTVVNGEPVQSGVTSDIIFGAEDVLEYLTGCVEVRPGDVIALGTPDGVGYFRSPRRWLRAGDVVDVSIVGIGTLTTTIAQEDQHARH